VNNKIATSSTLNWKVPYIFYEDLTDLINDITIIYKNYCFEFENSLIDWMRNEDNEITGGITVCRTLSQSTKIQNIKAKL